MSDKTCNVSSSAAGKKQKKKKANKQTKKQKEEARKEEAKHCKTQIPSNQTPFKKKKKRCFQALNAKERATSQATMQTNSVSNSSR
eukprot:m.136321 g.136321  ORF g.136321 m.136321 type:complete len:86 (+) comp20190_c2_seq1:953-1210(+)